MRRGRRCVWPSFETPRKRAAPQDDGGVVGGTQSNCLTHFAELRRSICPFTAAGLIPYSAYGEDPAKSQKADQNPEIQGAPAGGAADRAGTGGTAQSRDQSRRQ